MNARAVATTTAFEHPALFYRGEREFLAGTVPFMIAGLEAGEPVAAAVPAPHLDLLRDALGAAAHRVRLLNMTEVGRNPGRIIPGVLRDFADRHPTGRVRIIGEPIWPGRTDLEYPACAQHEALINLAFHGRPVTILCPYDADRLPAPVLTDAEATHPAVITAEGAKPSPGFAFERVIATYNLEPMRPAGEPAGFEFDNDTLFAARDFTVRRLTTIGLADQRALDAELAVGELAANSVRHGGGSGRLSIWREDGHAVCEVQDTGHVRDPLAGRVPVADSTGGGRGLLLVNHLADLVRTYTVAGHTSMRLYFRL